MAITTERSDQQLAFVREVNEAVTLILEAGGAMSKANLDSYSVEVETAAILLAATFLGVAGGDMEAARTTIWPRQATRQLRMFEAANAYQHQVRGA